MMASSIVNAWADAIWRASWQSTLVFCGVWLICRTIPSLPPRCRSWMWRIVVAKFLIVLFLPSIVMLPVLPEVVTSTRMANKAMVIVQQTSRIDPANPANVCRNQIFFGIWFAGMAWQIVRTLLLHHRFTRVKRNCFPIHDRGLLTEYSMLASRFGFLSPPQLLQCEGSGSPFAMQIIHPAVALPISTMRRLDDAERRLAIAHELAHIWCHDLAWAHLAMMARVLFFFHPLLWLAERHMHAAHEIAADDLARRQLRIDPVCYGKRLVSVVSKIDHVEFLPEIVLGMAGSIDGLTRRLAAMGIMHQMTFRARVSSLFLLGLIAVVGVIPWRLVATRSKSATTAASTSFTNLTEPGNHPSAAITVDEDEDDVTSRYKAIITVSRRLYGQSSRTLLEQSYQYQSHGEAFIVVDDELSLEIAVKTNHEQSPETYEMRAKFIKNPKSPTPDNLFAPRVTAFVGADATVSETSDGGDELSVSVVVNRVRQAAAVTHAGATDSIQRPILQYYVGVNR